MSDDAGVGGRAVVGSGDPLVWTVDEIIGIIPKVLHDPKAVDALIRLLAVRDPHRAQEVLDTIEVGIQLRGGIADD